MEIIATLPVSPAQREIFAEIAPHAYFTYTDKAHITQEQVKKAEVILGNLPAGLLKSAEKLRWLQLNSAGAESYTKPGVLPEGVRLTNASGAYGLAISEHMVAMVLCQMKKLPGYLAHQAQGAWQDEGPVRSVVGSKTLVVGMGDIGSEFAKRMHALGGQVVGIRRSQAQKPAYVERLCQMDALETLLPEMDIVAICLPGTEQTKHLFDEAKLRSMKQGALLVNVGRGNIVDTNALCRVLESGHLSGACLDVVEPEPLPAKHPLWHAPGAMITPHVAGGYHLPITLARILGICQRNLRAYLSGDALENLVDFNTGYRTTQP